MLKTDLTILYEDFKLIPVVIGEIIKKNILLSILLFVIYLALFFIDPVVRELFSKIHNELFDFLFNIGHMYGKLYLPVITIIVFYITGYALKKNNIRVMGFMFFESLAFSGVIVTFLKSLFGRWRPYTGHGNFSYYFLTFGPNDHLSFPSGDVAVAFAFSTIVAGFLENKAWKIFWFGLATLTALGRIYHDQHWLSDVILAIAISVSTGLYVINRNKIS